MASAIRGGKRTPLDYPFHNQKESAMTIAYKGFTLATLKGSKPTDNLYSINRGTTEEYVIEKVPDGGYVGYRPAVFIQFPKQTDRLARSEYKGETAEELFVRWVDER